jgi:hypothetical protein
LLVDASEKLRCPLRQQVMLIHPADEYAGVEDDDLKISS